MIRVALAAILLLLPAEAGLAAEPECAKECSRLEREGLLREGVHDLDCERRVCLTAVRRHYEDNEFTAALALLDYMKEGSFGRPAYEFERGITLYALDRFDDAIESFERVLIAYPASIRSGSQKAHALARLDRVADARKQFESLLDKPGMEGEYKGVKVESYIRGNIGVLKLREGRVPEAKADLNSALEIDGHNSFAGTYLYIVTPAVEAGALAPAGIGQVQKASELRDLGRTDEAVAVLEQVVRAWPQFELGWEIYGDTYRRTNRFAECEQVMGRAEAALPGHTNLRVQRIRCSLIRHGVESAEAQPLIAELRAIVDAEPENKTALEILAALDELR